MVGDPGDILGRINKQGLDADGIKETGISKV